MDEVAVSVRLKPLESAAASAAIADSWIGRVILIVIDFKRPQHN